MRILVIGAGIIGTIYGGHLAQAGHDIVMLARRRRLAEIRAHGLALEDILTGRRSDIRVKAVDAITAHDDFDLVLVTVRDRQLNSVLPALDALASKPDILFFMNCPLRVAELIGRFGAGRVLFGFPGAGGIHIGHVVRFSAVRQQPTTFGSVAGQPGGKATRLAALFASAGFSTSIVADMEAWLKTHAFLIAAICGALYKNGGKSARLAEDREGLLLLRQGVREGFCCIRALGFAPSPTKLRLLVSYVPKSLLIHFLKKFFSSKLAEFAIDGHAVAAPGDMRDLADDCRTMIGMSGTDAPDVQRLCAYVDTYVEKAAASQT